MLQGILLPQCIPVSAACLQEKTGVKTMPFLFRHHLFHRSVPGKSAAAAGLSGQGIIGPEQVSAGRYVKPDIRRIRNLEIRRTPEGVDDCEIGTQPHRVLPGDQDRFELIQSGAGAQRLPHQFSVPRPGHPDGIRAKVVGQVVGNGETGLVDAGIGIPAFLVGR